MTNEEEGMRLGARGRVLIVDDDEGITQALKLGFEHNGIKADAYNDPVEAVEGFEPGVYDLVLLDVRMPGMNGFQVYKELRRRDGSIKIFFLTSFDVHEEEFRQLFPEVKGLKFLRKPVSMGDLIKEVRRTLVAE